MKYLVGAANNTWRLPDAIQAAADGDTIEFQAGYSPVVDTIILNKSLHFKGNVTMGEGGNRNFTNVITGKFNMRQQANVTFENIWICYSVPKTNIINCAEQAEGHSNVVLRTTTIMENPKLYMKMYVGNSKLEIEDCVFQDCKL